MKLSSAAGNGSAQLSPGLAAARLRISWLPIPAHTAAPFGTRTRTRWRCLDALRAIAMMYNILLVFIAEFEYIR